MAVVRAACVCGAVRDSVVLIVRLASTGPSWLELMQRAVGRIALAISGPCNYARAWAQCRLVEAGR